LDDELFVPDDLEPLELDEEELLELVLLAEEEDVLVEPDEEVLENDLDPAREKLNDPLLPVSEVRSNSGTRIVFSRDEYLIVTPLRIATLTSGFQSLNRFEDCCLLTVSFVPSKIHTEGWIIRLGVAVPPGKSG